MGVDHLPVTIPEVGPEDWDNKTSLGRNEIMSVLRNSFSLHINSLNWSRSRPILHISYGSEGQRHGSDGWVVTGSGRRGSDL